MIEYFLLAPPYAEFVPVLDPEAMQRSVKIPRGALLALRPGPDAGVLEVMEELERFQRQIPHLPQILRLDALDPSRGTDLVGHAALIGVRMFQHGAAPEPAHLRRQATDLTVLPHDVVRKFPMLGFPLDPGGRDLFRIAIRLAPECPSIKAFNERTRYGYSHWQRALRHADLGNPGPVYYVLRRLVMAVEVQKDPGTSEFRMAHRFGLYDDAALRAALGDTFGCSVSDIRELIGWDGLLVTALKRIGYGPRVSRRTGKHVAEFGISRPVGPTGRRVRYGRVLLLNS